MQDFQVAQLSPGPLQKVRLDLTTRCNLRCVYCSVSQLDYQEVDMPAEFVRKATDDLTKLCHHDQLSEVHINGHGETTFLEGWENICRPLLDKGLSVILTTNLAKRYSESELEVLARMTVIAISIDTCDADLLKRLRRRVDLNQIVTNIELIRKKAHALAYGPPPGFEFSCGLYDQNSLFIEDLARFAVTLGIRRVGFWNLDTWHHEGMPYWNTNVPEADRVYPLDTLSPDELQPRLEAIRRGIGILNDNGVSVHINADSIETLSQQCNSGLTTLPAGMTRDCLDPWTYAELEANGDVKPCCARKSVGNLAFSSLPEILDGEPIRKVRAGLLEGNLDKDCRECTLRGTIAPNLLQEKVSALGSDLRTAARIPEAALGRAQELYRLALQNLEGGLKEESWKRVAEALAIDPGIEELFGGKDMIRRHLETILAESVSPATLTWLAAICRASGDHQTSFALLRRYVDMAPDAPDREHVLADIAAADSKSVKASPSGF